MVSLVEYTTVTGIPINSIIAREQSDKVVQQTINSGADVIKLKGATTYVPVAVIAMMADAVIQGRKLVLSVSICSNGE